MEKEKLDKLTSAIYSAGWKVSEIKEEYEKKFSPGTEIPRTEYGEKTGAILLRLTPVEA